MFTQVHSKSERAQGGLGIGLALVRRLAEMHGGTATVHSEGVGRGAEFVVRLPVMAPQLAGLSSQKRESGTIPRIDPQRILVADDNHDAAEALSLQLRLAGHEVRTPTMASRRLRWRRPSSRTSSCSISGCRRWTATRLRGAFACDQEAGA